MGGECLVVFVLFFVFGGVLGFGFVFMWVGWGVGVAFFVLLCFVFLDWCWLVLFLVILNVYIALGVFVSVMGGFGSYDLVLLDFFSFRSTCHCWCGFDIRVVLIISLFFLFFLLFIY